MSWTRERKRLLRLLWKSNWSCAAIAVALGEVSREAVAGKIHRLRAGEDAEILLGDLARRIYAASGLRPVDHERARRLVAAGVIDTVAAAHAELDEARLEDAARGCGAPGAGRVMNAAGRIDAGERAARQRAQLGEILAENAAGVALCDAVARLTVAPAFRAELPGGAAADLTLADLGLSETDVMNELVRLARARFERQRAAVRDALKSAFNVPIPALDETEQAAVAMLADTARRPGEG